MKTCFTYGCIMTFASALITLALFFAGFHNDPAKIGTAGWIQGLLGLAISITVLVLGQRARRAETPPDKPFGYGTALGNGLLIAAVALITGVIFQFVYESYINTGFIETYPQAQSMKLEAKGLSQDQIDRGMTMMRKFSGPIVRAIFGLVVGGIFMVIVALITSAFCTRPNPDQSTTL